MSEIAPPPLPEMEDAPARTNAGSKWGWCGLLLAVIVGLVVRQHDLGTVHSWFDESLGWRMAQFSPGEIIERSERNVHPPAHFLLLSAWSRIFGGSLLSLRYYSLVWGLGTVVGGYFLARTALDSSRDDGSRQFAGMFAGLLIAFSPLHIYWSQQVKMYALGTCLTVWSTWFLVQWFQSGGTYRLVCYVLLAAILALQHHYGTFTVFGQLTFALGWAACRWWSGTSRGELAAILIAGWATVSLWSLWLPSFLIQRALVQDRYWIGSFRWEDVPGVWSGLFLANTSLPTSRDVTLVIAQLVLASVVFLLVLRRPGARLIGWLVLVPFAMALAWSVWDQNVLVARFLINAHVCLLVGLAVLVASLPLRSLKYGLAVALLVGVGFTGYRQWEQRTRQAELSGMTAAVTTLREAKAAGEPVLVCNPMLYLNVCVHHHGLRDVFAFDPGYSFPHFQGTPVMKDEDYLSLAAVEDAGHEWVWTLDAEKWLGGDWQVRLPGNWVLEEEQRIPEWYATLVIRSYRRESPSLGERPRVAGRSL